MAVSFHDQDIASGLKDKRKLGNFLTELVKSHRKEVKKVSLTYIFCTDAFLIDMNQQFLDHDTYTDIITFELSEKDTEMVGEMYISVERIRENADKFKVSFLHELHRVIFHGALHLCGFNDKKPALKEEMHRQEDICLQQYGIEK